MTMKYDFSGLWEGNKLNIPLVGQSWTNASGDLQTGKEIIEKMATEHLDKVLEFANKIRKAE